MESGRDERWQQEQDWVQQKYKQYKEQSVTYMAMEDKRLSGQMKRFHNVQSVSYSCCSKGKKQHLVHGASRRHDGDKDVIKKTDFFNETIISLWDFIFLKPNERKHKGKIICLLYSEG